MNLHDINKLQPVLKLEEFFSGKSKAYGLFEDRFGKVRTQFSVDIDGVWDGETLTLHEDFLYADGDKEVRTWTIRKTGTNTYKGETDQVIGVASGATSGTTFNWRYDFNLKVGDGKFWKVSFDDWMFLQPDGVLLNKARIKRWGVTLGTVFISFTKVPQQLPDSVNMEDPANEAGNRDTVASASFQSAE